MMGIRSWQTKLDILEYMSSPSTWEMKGRRSRNYRLTSATRASVSDNEPASIADRRPEFFSVLGETLGFGGMQ